MLIKTSKETTDRQKAFVFLHSVFLLQGPGVARDMAERFHSPAGEGEAPATEPAFLPMILGFGRVLKELLAQMVAADEAHYAKKAVQNAMLEKRNDLSGKLTRLLVALRRTILGHHEKPDLHQLGLEGETARDPVPVLRQADRIVEILAGGEIDELLGDPIFEGCSFEPKDRGQQLQAQADELRFVVDGIGGVKRRTENAFLDKEEAIKAYDQLFTRAARTFEDWCRLIGRDELADRIRPSESRPGRTRRQPPETPEETAEAGSEGDPGESPAAS